MNALKICKEDLKNILHNPITLIIICGLIILPSMYAWFNIQALIDPYGNAKNLPIAVYNEDKGQTINGNLVNIGDEVISNLHENNELFWQYPQNYDEMMDSLNVGNYYAVVIIPETFTKDLFNSIDSYQGSSIKYIVNEKVNAIAPKMTEAGAQGIQSEINSTINGTVTEELVNYSNELNDKVKEKKGIYESLMYKINNLVNNFDNVDNKLNELSSISNEVEHGLTTVDKLDKEIDDYINSINLMNIKSFVDSTNNSLLDSAYKELDNIISQMQEINSDINVNNEIEEYNNIDSKLNEINNDLWPAFKEEIILIQNKLENIQLDYNKISEYLSKDGNDANTFMANPVSIDSETIYPVENYGSASMPFYTTLCLWVGSLLMASLLSFKSKLKATKVEQYFGKMLLFVIIALLQSLIVSLGNIYLLDISISNNFALIVFDMFIALIFTIIVYTIVYVFGNIGKAICIIILVLSISGGGGNFPIEVSGSFYNFIYNYLPFTYGVRLLREAGAGIYMKTVQECIIIMTTMGVILIGFGIVGSKYIKEFFDNFDIKSRKDEIIH